MRVFLLVQGKTFIRRGDISRKRSQRSRGLLRVFRFQMIDVRTVDIRQRRAFDKENVLGVELCAPRKVIRTGDHSIVDHENLVMHEIVAPGRRVRR